MNSALSATNCYGLLPNTREYFSMRGRRLHVAQTAVVYVLPRQIAVYIARQLTSASLKEIGREFGHRVR